MLLTKRLLQQIGACSQGIKFCDQFNLWGFPLDRLDEIEGDHKGFISWLNDVSLKTSQFDPMGNVLRVSEIEADEFSIENTYDDQGRLIEQAYYGTYREVYEYDNVDRLTMITCNEGVFEFKYLDQEEQTYCNGKLTNIKKFNGQRIICEEFYDQGELIWIDWYTYGLDDRLVSIETKYQASDKAITKMVNFYHDGSLLVQQIDSVVCDEFTRKIIYNLDYYPNGQLKRINDLVIPLFT